MDNTKNYILPLLPHWCITDLKPALYDVESSSAIGQTAKLYGTMQKLLETHNTWVDDINNLITDFNETTIQDFECFKTELVKICNNYIKSLDMKFYHQDKKVEEAIKYMKDNLTESIIVAVREMQENGELNDEILEAFNGITSTIQSLQTDNITNKSNIESLQTDNETNKTNIESLQTDNETNKTNIESLQTDNETNKTNIENNSGRLNNLEVNKYTQAIRNDEYFGGEPVKYFKIGKVVVVSFVLTVNENITANETIVATELPKPENNIIFTLNGTDGSSINNNFRMVLTTNGDVVNWYDNKPKNNITYYGQLIYLEK